MRLPVGRLAAAMLAGQGRGAAADGGDDGIVPGRTIIVTDPKDSVTFTFNGINRTYSVTPNVLSKVIVDVDGITNLTRAFDYLNSTYIDLSNFDSSNATLFSSLFERSFSLESINLAHFNTSKATKINGMFYFCQSLKSIDVSSFDTSNVTDMGYLFAQCSLIESLDISNFDASKVTRTDAMFAGMTRLNNLKFMKNLKRSIILSHAPLTHESALSVIEGLAEVDTAQTVTFKATTYGTLTEEEIALATSRGWSVVSA